MKALFGQIGRLFWREILQLAFFLIFCFFALFILVDYSSRAYSWPLKGMQWAYYYGAIFVRRMDLLVPFALLIAVVRTVCQANQRYQITAMMASGISLQRLFAPCFAVGLLGTTLLYAIDMQLWAPSAQSVRIIEEKHMQHRFKRRGEERVHSLHLQDGSLILYRAYLLAEEQLVDVYWVVSVDALYRMESLHIHGTIAEGQDVSYWLKNAEGQYFEAERRQVRPFPEMQLGQALLNQVRTAPVDRSLWQLWEQLPAVEALRTQENNRIESAWYRRLSMPWLAFLACVFPLPWCVRFRRDPSIFLLSSSFLATLAFCYLTFSAVAILSDNGYLPAREGMLGMMSLLVGIATLRFFRMRSG